MIDLIKLFGNIDNFDDLKNKLDTNSYTIIDDEKVFMIIKNSNDYKSNSTINLDTLFDDYTSHIFSKKDYKYITSFEKISRLNDEAKAYILTNHDKWDEFTIIQSFEGPVIQVFFCDKWYICTEQSLTAENYYGNINKSIRHFFLDTGKLPDPTKLDNSYVYHFILLHNKLKHIVQYSNLGPDYKELALLNTTQNGNNVVCNTNLPFLRPMVYHFSCYDELEATLDKITYDNATYKRISTEGFIIKHNTKIMKLQTEIYQQIEKFKPLKQNNYQIFLELYQHDKLNDILPFISKYSNEIIHRINMSMRTLSREILNIYHTTRKKKSSELYDALPDSYKKILYEIHGLYIKGRKKDFVNGKELQDKDTRSITVHDIYYYLKNLPESQLKQIYLDRVMIMKNESIIPYLNLNCIYTLTQSRLMTC